MKLNQNFTLRTVAGKHMLVNTQGKTSDLSTFFTVNDPLAWLWQRIGTMEFTEEMLADMVCEEYEVEYEVALNDVRDVLQAWRAYGIVK